MSQGQSVGQACSMSLLAFPTLGQQLVIQWTFLCQGFGEALEHGNLSEG